MAKQVSLADLVIDCPDEKKLCNFYLELLGWERLSLFGHPAAVNENGLMLLFVQEDDYVPPVWPEEEGKQQKQIHLDFLVPDVDAAVAKAESLGAVKTEEQFGADIFTTMLDPAGHPFCLCKEE